jgi:hypothetical protein
MRSDLDLVAAGEKEKRLEKIFLKPFDILTG